MQAAAGTEVVVDILFLQKRRLGQTPVGAAWLDMAEAVPADDGEAALPINRYFLDHPEMVLGEHARTSSPFGPVYTCKARRGVTLGDALDRALGVVSTGARIPVGEAVQAGRPKAARIVVGTAAEGATVKEGSYVLLGLDLNQIIDGVPVPVAVKTAASKEGVFAKHARIIRGLIPIRDAVRCVLRAQEANEPWGQAQSGSVLLIRASCGNSARSTTPGLPPAPMRKPVRSERPCIARTWRPSSTIPIAGSSPRSRTMTRTATTEAILKFLKEIGPKDRHIQSAYDILHAAVREDYH